MKYPLKRATFTILKLAKYITVQVVIFLIILDFVITSCCSLVRRNMLYMANTRILVLELVASDMIRKNSRIGSFYERVAE